MLFIAWDIEKNHQEKTKNKKSSQKNLSKEFVKEFRIQFKFFQHTQRNFVHRRNVTNECETVNKMKSF